MGDQRLDYEVGVEFYDDYAFSGVWVNKYQCRPRNKRESTPMARGWTISRRRPDRRRLHRSRSGVECANQAVVCGDPARSTNQIDAAAARPTLPRTIARLLDIMATRRLLQRETNRASRTEHVRRRREGWGARRRIEPVRRRRERLRARR